MQPCPPPPHCLTRRPTRRYLIIKLVQDNFFSDSGFGKLRIDLYTLATGPLRHRLPIRDGGHVRGYIDFCLDMEEVAPATLQLVVRALCWFAR